MKKLNLSQDVSYARLRRGFPDFPSVGLPICPRSAGGTVLKNGIAEHNDGAGKPFVQISWISRGSGTFLLENRLESAGEGDVLIQYPFQARCNTASGPLCVIRWLTFDGADAVSFMKSYCYPPVIRGCGVCPEERFRQYEKALESGSGHSFRSAVCVITELLALVGVGLETKEREQETVRSFRVCAERMFHDPSVDINTLCAVLNVHRSTLCRAFQETSFSSPAEYLRKLRMHHAMELLASGRCSVAEAARRSGFWNASYFTQIAKRMTGLTPKQLKSLR